MKYELHQPETAQLVVCRVEDPMGPAIELWQIEYDGMDGPPPVDLAQNLLSIASAEEDGPPPFTLDRKQSYYEWGASGATETVILSVLGAAAYELLRAQVGTLIGQISKRSMGEYLANPVTKDEAVERSRWRLASMFGVDGDTLELRAVSQQDSSWLVTFRLDNADYEVKLDLHQGYPTVVEATMRKFD